MLECELSPVRRLGKSFDRVGQAQPGKRISSVSLLSQTEFCRFPEMAHALRSEAVNRQISRKQTQQWAQIAERDSGYPIEAHTTNYLIGQGRRTRVAHRLPLTASHSLLSSEHHACAHPALTRSSAKCILQPHIIERLRTSFWGNPLYLKFLIKSLCELRCEVSR